MAADACHHRYRWRVGRAACGDAANRVGAAAGWVEPHRWSAGEGNATASHTALPPSFTAFHRLSPPFTAVHLQRPAIPEPAFSRIAELLLGGVKAAHAAAETWIDPRGSDAWVDPRRDAHNAVVFLNMLNTYSLLGEEAVPAAGGGGKAGPVGAAAAGGPMSGLDVVRLGGGAALPSLPTYKALSATLPSLPTYKALSATLPSLPTYKALSATLPSLPTYKALSATIVAESAHFIADFQQ